jgi:hypothetical protein
VFTDSR